MGVPGSAAAGRDKAPLGAAQAVTIILDLVCSGSWRILVGKDEDDRGLRSLAELGRMAGRSARSNKTGAVAPRTCRGRSAPVGPGQWQLTPPG